MDFVAEHEGLRLTAYPDPATGREPFTIGYGSAHGVMPGMTITEAEARTRLLADLQIAAQRLETAVGEVCVTELTANQYAALLSFVFNVGLKPEWQIVKCLKAHQFDAVPAELMRFVNAGGKKLSGLVNRRADEVKLWSTDEPGSIPDDPSSSVTRVVDTPPTAAVVKPLAKSKSWAGGLVTAALAVGAPLAGHVQTGVKQIADAIEPYAGSSAILQHMQGALQIAGAVSAVVLVGLLWLKNREAKAS